MEREESVESWSAPQEEARPRPGAWDAPPPEAAPAFSLGDDVVHAAFGEGVVTAVEPGGIVVVRFAEDGSERKLMGQYAPISRRE